MERTVPREALRQLVLALEVHHLDAGEGGRRVLRVEKAHAEQLQRELVLAHAREGVALLDADLDVVHRRAQAELHVPDPDGLRPHAAVVQGGEAHLAALARDAKLPWQIVKLPDQLDAHAGDLLEAAVARAGGVAAALAGGLLQGGDGGGRGHAAADDAVGRLGVAAGLAQLGDLVLVEFDVVARQRAVIHRPDPGVVEGAGDVDDGAVEVAPLVHVDRRALPLEVARRRPGQRVFDERGVHHVELDLRVHAQVHVAVAAGAALDRPERVEDEGVHPVVVQAAAGAGRGGRVVFGAREDDVVDVLAEVQDGPAVLDALVVDVHDIALAVGRDAVVAEKARERPVLSSEFALELRIAPLELPVVPQLDVEKVPALLDVPHAGLPEHAEQVAALDPDIAQTVVPVGVPGDLVHAGAGLELVPPGVGVDLLEAGLLHDHGQHVGEHVRLLPVAGLAGQDQRLGVVFHGVGVLGDDDVVQPSALGPKLPAEADVLLRLLGLVAQLPPLLGGHDAPLEAGLAVFVLLQDGVELPESLRIDGQREQLPVRGHDLVFVHAVTPCSSYSMDRTGSAAPGRFGSAAPAATCTDSASRRRRGPPASCPDPRPCTCRTSSAGSCG